jgi:biopolymer transport protein ExbD
MNEKPFESINVIPFIDIMLVLLTMVLTTANFIVTGRISVALPQASPTHVEKRQDKMIELTADGTIYFDNAPVALGVLENTVRELPPDTSFLIRADRNLAFQKFIDIADMLKRLDFNKVAVQTRSTAR